MYKLPCYLILVMGFYNSSMPIHVYDLFERNIFLVTENVSCCSDRTHEFRMRS